jgi:hypothetical protein
MPAGLKITNGANQVIFNSAWIAGVDYDEDLFYDDDHNEEEDGDDNEKTEDEANYDEMDENDLADILQQPNEFQVPHETGNEHEHEIVIEEANNAEELQEEEGVSEDDDDEEQKELDYRRKAGSISKKEMKTPKNTVRSQRRSQRQHRVSGDERRTSKQLSPNLRFETRYQKVRKTKNRSSSQRNETNTRSSCIRTDQYRRDDETRKEESNGESHFLDQKERRNCQGASVRGEWKHTTSIHFTRRSIKPNRSVGSNHYYRSD